MCDIVLKYIIIYFSTFGYTGEVYLAQFSEDQWVRAELEHIHAAYVTLLFIDFGHKETVSREK